MNLRRQLLLVSLLLVALPWAGCQYVREMEGALQQGQEQALLATARAVATVLSDKPELFYPDLARWRDGTDTGNQLYAKRADAPVIVDGYADGWEGPPQQRFGNVSYQALVRGDQLYLLFTVTDDQVVYHDPRRVRRASGDRLVLRSGRGLDYVIATAAPGAVQARIERKSGAMAFEPRIRGFWQDSLEGFTVELELPLALLDDRLGFYLVEDSGVPSTGVAQSAGTISPGRGKPPWLIYPPAALGSVLAPFSQSGVQLIAVDVHRWEIGGASSAHEDGDSVEEDGGAGDNPTGGATGSPWLLKALYRAILNGSPLPIPATDEPVGQVRLAEVETALGGEGATHWYGAPDGGNQKLLSAAAPVFSKGAVSGVILARQSSERYLSLTDRAFSRLLYYSLLALLISALGLLGYASWLSWRIRGLSQATASVMQPDGSLSDSFPVSHSRDEIGELSRHYAELLSRLRDYTGYLRTLSRKLSHELRTPIAVIQSSLDNLQAGGEDDVYLNRAREGLSRLSNILTAMSEATRLEESVHSNHAEDYDLVLVCRELFAAYSSLYADHKLQFESSLSSQAMVGVPELVAQMLDKLVDNAASFAPAGGTILMTLNALPGDQVEICVSNDGPTLPEAMQQQLFDSMVSVREKSDRMHLGLGLHIVRLIVDFHGGTVQAENRPDGSGVNFRVVLPTSLPREQGRRARATAL